MAEVSDAFDEAVKRIENLENTRTLFWRNVMHEFKTPLTQGILMVHMLNESSTNKEQLIDVFDRMQIQLDKLKELEYIKADNVELVLQEVSILDVIDDVVDKFQLDENAISYQPTHQKYRLNPDLFGVALKNLLANAITYSSDLHVDVVHKHSHLYIINKGEVLSDKFEKYTHAFVRDEVSKSGMGLGLYIAKEICVKHKIAMKYRYLRGYHLIILDMKKVERSHY